nr:immunoglobulin heavy chain junction region [Macaca mulatta]MOV38719.1 immunoglobulin heavy chain junction region [Macaca mulatta]MOV38941.1 immunoglobulin heavy chain junction region [Macaca mulatta]MOV39059.1 immunoglobulin heavy chain junction region [Macaca mulatta]MOV39158.1 immunoglobulin heavy chain junction region [Macaca mulatta]
CARDSAMIFGLSLDYW